MCQIVTYKKKIMLGILTVLLMGAMVLLRPVQVFAAEGLDMSTDYPGVSAKAGETLSFGLDFTADSSCDVSLSIDSIPEGWSGYFRGGDGQISKVHVNAGTLSSDLATFYLTLPDELDEGVYKIRLKADGGNGKTDTMELEIKVAAQQEGDSNFQAEYPEQEGSTGTSFSFDATIANNRSVEQSYSLSANAPSGWSVSFTPSSESTKVASMTVNGGSSSSLTIDVTPPETVEKGEYTIPCTAVSSSETLSLELKVIITGTYDVELTTPSGRLSLDAYANNKESVTITIKNNGNVDLNDLKLTSSGPSSWEVTFEEDTIETLSAGESKDITAYIKPDSDAMTGDYVTTLKVSNDETSSSAEFRISVKTRTSWGFCAVAIIAALISGLGYVFKKYGRR